MAEIKFVDKKIHNIFLKYFTWFYNQSKRLHNEIDGYMKRTYQLQIQIYIKTRCPAYMHFMVIGMIMIVEC